ncbi:MAG: epoxyqueuosine reductase [Desulforhabdus sp.]|nr:epoxyqueuosine reductase [Desulforhabdus sp.]
MGENLNRAADPVVWLQNEIAEFTSRWRQQEGTEDYWLNPLAAVLSAKDPMLAELRRVVDPEHAMPHEILERAWSVIVFFLPFQRWLGEQNDRHGLFAARSWAEAYTTTNRLIVAINQHLKECLTENGHQAATTPPTHNFDEQKLVSRWSHKHLAYIAGLGTFGHNHLLITAAGCCGRLGSLVTSMPLPAAQRPNREWCLLKAGYHCHACVGKCVYGALQKAHFDRQICYRQCLANNAHYAELSLVDVCGKCACELPCSHQIPKIPATQQR